jgi:hypothetical protein
MHAVLDRLRLRHPEEQEPAYPLLLQLDASGRTTTITRVH